MATSSNINSGQPSLSDLISKSCPLAFCVISPDGTISTLNGSFNDLIPGKHATVVGKNLFALLPPDYSSVLNAFTTSTLKDQKTTEFNYNYIGQELKHTIIPFLKLSQSDKKLVIWVEDLTLAKNSFQAYSESEALNRSLLQAIPDLMFIYNYDLIILDYYASSFDDLVTPPDQFIGKPLTQVLNLDENSAYISTIKKTIDTGLPHHYEFSLEIRGQHKTFEARMVPLSNDRVLSIVRNITERKKIEEELRLSENLFRNLFSRLPLGLYRTSATGKLLEGNPAIIQLLGFKDFNEIVETNFFDYFVQPQVRTENINQICASKTSRIFEYQLRRKDNSIIWVRDQCKPIFSENGQVEFFEGVLEDITNHTIALEKIKQSEELFRLLAEKANDLISLHKQDLSLLYVSPSVFHLLGYKPEDLLNQSLITLVHPDDTEKLTQEIHNNRYKKLIPNIETRWMNKNGNYRWFETSLQQVIDTNGELIQVVMISRDIGDRKLSDSKLKDTQLQLAERIKELERSTKELNLLTEMANILQIISETTESGEVIRAYGNKLFPDLQGAIYLLAPDSTQLQIFTSWGQNQPSTYPIIKLGDCWALRRGRMYIYHNNQTGPLCTHIPKDYNGCFLCLPMQSENKSIGLFTLQTSHASQQISTSQQQLAAVFTEQINLALSNLRLRDRLKIQATHDPLTGLMNRYFMEESLERELKRAQRNKTTVGIIMFDLDYFKSLNTRFGHPTVDKLLQKFGQLLKTNFRASDIACRYGGDEFLLILPEADLKSTYQKANQFREIVKELTVQNDKHSPQSISISAGVAEWPTHGNSTAELLNRVDEALLKAKEQHDCIRIAD